MFREAMALTTPAVSILTAVTVLGLTSGLTWKNHLVAGARVAPTRAIKALGVPSGFPFGIFTYTDTFVLKVIGVAVVIPFRVLVCDRKQRRGRRAFSRNSA
jgi:uncharacterized membrane protein